MPSDFIYKSHCAVKRGGFVFSTKIPYYSNGKD